MTVTYHVQDLVSVSGDAIRQLEASDVCVQV